MAAGLSIEEKNIEEFRRRLNVNCTLTDEELRPKIVIDVPMPVSYITKELVKCADLMIQFGGHPMAAGLSIEEKNIEEFRRRLNVNCTLTDEESRPKIVIDVPMPVSYITKELVEQISLLEPFGKGNTKPVFAQKNLRVLDYSIIGKNKNVVKLKLLDPQGISVEGIYFGEAEDFVNFIREKDSISVTYYPEINRFRGRESLQIIIQNYC